MKKSIITGLLLGFHLIISAQGGINVNAGLVLAHIDDQLFTPKGTALYGYQIGADARLNEGSMYFNPGLHYIKLSMEPQESPDFFGHNGDFDIIKGRFGLGFLLVNFSDEFKLRAKAIGSINYIMSSDPLFKELYPDSKLNEAFAGIDIGIGFDFFALTADLEYEYGLVNMINKVDETTMNMWRFSLGFFF